MTNKPNFIAQSLIYHSHVKQSIVSMLGYRLIATFLLITLTACSNPAVSPPTASTSAPATSTIVATASPVPSPTQVPPTPTPQPIAKNVTVGGVKVGGLSPEAAYDLVEKELGATLRPLDIRAEQEQLTITPDDIKLGFNVQSMIDAATKASSGDRIPLEVSFERSLLEQRLQSWAKSLEQAGSVTVLTSTKTISRSFVLAGVRSLDIPTAIDTISERLQSPEASRRITLSLVPVALKTDARPTAEQLQEQIEAMAKQWKGVVGIYVYDLDTGQEVASLNKDTVFSGASVMKVPILLNAYINLEKFDTRHETWLRKMIVESDNYSANSMLAVSVGGGPTDTDKALEGALAMSDMMKKSLDLEHTYQNMPYEAADYLIKVRGITIKRGPAVEGPKPYTDADPVLRTTPFEMSSIFLMIEQCSNGQGILLEKFDTLSSARCMEMIKRLEQNGDKTRMVAGLPANTVVAHKSGWIEDMQADVGIVRSPGGNYLTAIYVYKDIRGTNTFLTDKVATPVIAAFSRLIYSYYNPMISSQ